MARFIVDAQLPPALARALTAKGHRAEHVEDAGLRHAKDAFIRDYAVRHQAILITKDDDFIERFRRRTGAPIIVWLRIGNASNRVLFTWFLPLVPTIMKRIELGDRFIEVR